MAHAKECEQTDYGGKVSDSSHRNIALSNRAGQIVAVNIFRGGSIGQSRSAVTEEFTIASVAGAFLRIQRGVVRMPCGDIGTRSE